MRMGVLYVMSHLAVTLGAFILYGVIYLMRGEPDPTLQNILLLIAGYWFGAMGVDVVRKRATGNKQDDSGDNSV